MMNLGLIFFYKEKPEFYPSKAAHQATSVEFSMKNDLKKLIKNKNYLFMLLTYSLLYGVYTCLGAVINNLVTPYGFDSTA